MLFNTIAYDVFIEVWRKSGINTGNGLNIQYWCSAFWYFSRSKHQHVCSHHFPARHFTVRKRV